MDGLSRAFLTQRADAMQLTDCIRSVFALTLAGRGFYVGLLSHRWTSQGGVIRRCYLDADLREGLLGERLELQRSCYVSHGASTNHGDSQHSRLLHQSFE
jgi:hypothetical protein